MNQIAKGLNTKARNSFLLSLFALGFIFVADAAKAADHKPYDLGVLLGYSSANSNGTSKGSLGFGIKGGYRIMPDWELGGEWAYMSTTPSTAPTGYTSKLNLFTVTYDYHFAGSMEGLFIGPKAGLAYTSAGGYNGMSFAAGGELGYNYYMGSLSVGPQINYLYVAAPTLNSVKGNSAGVFQAFASAKYWF